MAIYHCSMKPIGRAGGRSAVAAAAYRAGDRLENQRDGVVHDYTAKAGVVQAEIVLPAGVEAAWALDRSALWNAAEAAEKRKDARVAREFEIALPHELSPEQHLAATREFAHDLARRTGAAVDFAIHAPHAAGDQRNHHAHVLVTTRRVGPEGLSEKTWLERENKWLLAQGRPTTDAQLREIRAAWEGIVNRHLAAQDLDLRIDHRSHAARGVALAPTEHVGVHATGMQRRGLGVTRVALDAQAAARNALLIAERPEEVLSLITHEKSVFDRRDIARALHRALPDDASGFQNALATVLASPALVTLQPEHTDPGTGAVTPARYATRAMVALEAGMVAASGRLQAAGTHGVAPARIAAAMARQDAAIQTSAGDPTAGLSPEQRVAIRHVTGPARIAAVVGFAGAGKSTMLAAAREAWEAQGYRVLGAALSGKAAEGLEESSGIPSRTLASWSLGWERDRGRLGRGDVFVIDEAGMVGSRQLAGFVAEAEARGAKIVLVGDHEQLQAIGAGAPFRAIAQAVGHAELGDIRRQRQNWQRAASVAFATHRTGEGLAAYAAAGAIRFLDGGAATRAAIVADALADRTSRPEGSRVVLAHRRVDVAALNAAIRSGLQAQGILGQGEAGGELAFATREGERAFVSGDRIVFLENDRGLGVKNGMLGTVEAVAAGRITVRLDGPAGGVPRRVEVQSEVYTAFDHGYATTIHKSQGATVDRAFVLASPTLDRHLTYVAMTRHRDAAGLYADAAEFGVAGPVEAGTALPERFVARLSRAGTKETTLDYAPAYAAQRGIAERLGIASTIALAVDAAAAAAPRIRRGMFDGLKLSRKGPAAAAPSVPGTPSADPAAPTPPERRSPFAGLKLSPGRPAEPEPAVASEPERWVARILAVSGFEGALGRYLRAYDARERQAGAGLPVLEGQTRELAAATAALEQARPGVGETLRSALEHDPEAALALAAAPGRARTAALVTVLEREAAVLVSPALRAERFVRSWVDLSAQRAALPDWQHLRARGAVEERMQALRLSLTGDPALEAALGAWRKELGITSRAEPKMSLSHELERSLAPERGPSLGLSLGF
ncbi:Ti-type conjugative transfer relaxase TraA [Methylobacterium sp. Leaf469]|uniref:Ti-type conjugative transfer relaxase TraA n=1 Tax=Methylobacterium sp. Leaf469 TaxID=1736387 RepID=UPI0009E800BE|nr:Ti-type conjugative transfer relaxase TraA [Methylobacterium sp. Leaf469]